MPGNKNRHPTRRKALSVIAAAAGFPLAAFARPGRDMPPVVRWRGIAMGAPAEITLCHPDPGGARRAVAVCLDEVARLERVFSLYQADSELAVLNRDGRLSAPSHDLVALMGAAARYGALSQGAFDVTVQPLWRLYAEHFTRHPADDAGPDRRRVEQALRLVDYRAVEITPGELRFARPGMAVTLNGIAQGAITDRIAMLLRDAGFERVLVELGEIRGVGKKPWRIGLEDPQAPGSVVETLPLADAALATSGGYGTRFDPVGRFHHLFDPATGDSARKCLSVSVSAPDATAADAAATALAVTGPVWAQPLLRAFGAVSARFTLAGGRTVRISARETG